MKLVIGKQFHEREIERIRAFQPDLEIVVAEKEEDLKREISDATILLSRSIPEGIESGEQLKWIQFTWEGVDHLTDAFMESDILLTNAGGVHSQQMAEHVFSYLLTIGRKVPMYLDLQKKAQWLDWKDQPKLVRMHGSTYRDPWLWKDWKGRCEDRQRIRHECIGVEKGSEKSI